MGYDIKPDECGRIFNSVAGTRGEAENVRAELKKADAALQAAAKHPSLKTALQGALGQVLQPHVDNAHARWQTTYASGREAVRLYVAGSDAMAHTAAQTAGNLPQGFTPGKAR